MLSKTNIREPTCSNVEFDNCESDPIFHLNTGVCVRTFNLAGERAVEKLREDARRWYGEMYDGAELNAGHTAKGRTDGTQEEN